MHFNIQGDLVPKCCVAGHVQTPCQESDNGVWNSGQAVMREVFGSVDGTVYGFEMRLPPTLA